MFSFQIFLQLCFKKRINSIERFLTYLSKIFGILFLSCLSFRNSVRNFNLAYYFWTVIFLVIWSFRWFITFWSWHLKKWHSKYRNYHKYFLWPDLYSGFKIFVLLCNCRGHFCFTNTSCNSKITLLVDCLLWYFRDSAITAKEL